MKRAIISLSAILLTFAFSVSAMAQTYTETASGMKGKMTVDVTIEDEVITEITVQDCVDTPVISDAAIDVLPQRIIDQQNIDVDNVTGATMTSLGIKSAVRSAIKDAGLDPDDYKKTVTDAAESFDLVIVGAGMSGLSAAISAARSEDISILVLEKEAYTGGSSRVCGGGIWAVDSALNEEVGINSTADELIEFLKGRSDGADLNEDLIRSFYDVAGDTIEYFYENGLPVDLETASLGHPDSKLPVLWSVHNAEHDWETGESGLIDAVQKMAEDLGVEIRLENKVVELLTEDGAVTGLRVETPDGESTIQADKVILATGGFTRNAEMIEKYAPEYKNAFAFTGAGSTGDGITLTEDLDTEVIGEGMMGLMGLNMNLGYYGSIGNLVWHPQMVVNKEGAVFGLQEAFYSETLKLLLEQTDSQAYGIFDASTSLSDRLEEAVEAGNAKKFDTLEELAASYKIDADALAKTAEEKALAEGPYYCIVIRPLFIGSIPGLKVDASCRVLTSEDAPIENLYACGELIFGNVFQERYPASSTGIGTSAYTGSLAGRTAVEDMNH